MNKKKLKNNKGITLIALIITIIVLLILAVVAIGTVQNDSIINHAKNARGEYVKAQINEKSILSDYLANIDEASYGVPAELVTYCLGEDKKGREVDLSNFSFKDAGSIKLGEEITPLNIGLNADATRLFGYIKYQNAAYRIVCKGNDHNIHYSTSVTTESIEKIYTPRGREGTTVQYDSNADGTPENWIIITDRYGKVEIISENVMYDAQENALAMGEIDTSVTVTSDLDGDGIKENDLNDIAIASYNNAITRVNEYCKTLVTAETDKTKIRSVGGTVNTATPYSSTNFKAWFKGKGSVPSGDTQYEEDFVKLSYWNKVATTDEYWIASRLVGEISDNVSFTLRSVKEGSISGWILFSVDNMKTVTSPSQPKLRCASSCYKSKRDLTLRL